MNISMLIYKPTKTKYIKMNHMQHINIKFMITRVKYSYIIGDPQRWNI